MHWKILFERYEVCREETYCGVSTEKIIENCHTWITAGLKREIRLFNTVHMFLELTSTKHWAQGSWQGLNSYLTCNPPIETNCPATNKFMSNFMLQIISVKLLVIVIIVFKHYPSTHCLMQGSCFICSNL